MPNPAEELQRKYIEFQLARQQFEAFAEEKKLVDEKITELAMTMSALKTMDEMGRGDEIWSPMGSGAFILSDIKDTDRVLVSIGAGIIIKESRGKAEKILQGRLGEMTRIQNDIVAELTTLKDQIEGLEPDLHRLLEKQQAEENRKTKRK